MFDFKRFNIHNKCNIRAFYGFIYGSNFKEKAKKKNN